MKKTTKESNGSKAEMKSALDELIQQGARQIIQQVVEAQQARAKKAMQDIWMPPHVLMH